MDQVCGSGRWQNSNLTFSTLIYFGSLISPSDPFIWTSRSHGHRVVWRGVEGPFGLDQIHEANGAVVVFQTAWAGGGALAGQKRGGLAPKKCELLGRFHFLYGIKPTTIRAVVG